MSSKHVKGWMKHWDFILIDIVLLHVCFYAVYMLVTGYRHPFRTQFFVYQEIILLAAQLLIILFGVNYSGILRRRKYDEFIAVGRYTAEIYIIALVYYFITHQLHQISRLHYGITFVSYLILDIICRNLNKTRLFSSGTARKKRSIVLITARRFVSEAMDKLTERNIYQDYFISEIVLMDMEDIPEAEIHEIKKRYDIPILKLDETAIEKISHDWVDEVFILQPDYMAFPSRLMDAFMEMGITVSYTMSALNDERWPITDIRKLGQYKVLTSSIRFAPVGQLLIKRAMDIVGGIIGCIITGVLCIFIAPIIYFKSPGPIFFIQERVGENGRPIKIYKFRSMYMDAEERKAALMKQNKIKSGMMFKLDDDPRIIGSEKKDRNGKPKGIGNFIRNTSLDEFPQFFCVLIGTMSLVGWRPATFDEWERYDLKHRIRASMKPGITGMWQVSGRSEITDFEEVVRLDKEYIENWNIALDIKILIKTLVVVLTRRGAE